MKRMLGCVIKAALKRSTGHGRWGAQIIPFPGATSLSQTHLHKPGGALETAAGRKASSGL